MSTITQNLPPLAISEADAIKYVGGSDVMAVLVARHGVKVTFPATGRLPKRYDRRMLEIAYNEYFLTQKS